MMMTILKLLLHQSYPLREKKSQASVEIGSSENRS